VIKHSHTRETTGKKYAMYTTRYVNQVGDQTGLTLTEQFTMNNFRIDKCVVNIAHATPRIFQGVCTHIHSIPIRYNLCPPNSSQTFVTYSHPTLYASSYHSSDTSKILHAIVFVTLFASALDSPSGFTKLSTYLLSLDSCSFNIPPHPHTLGLYFGYLYQGDMHHFSSFIVESIR
jgi:hypothetical protein